MESAAMGIHDSRVFAAPSVDKDGKPSRLRATWAPVFRTLARLNFAAARGGRLDPCSCGRLRPVIRPMRAGSIIGAPAPP